MPGPAPKPGPLSSTGSGRLSSPDIVSAFLVFIISGIGFLIVGSRLIDSSSADLALSPPLFLLAVLPILTLVFFLIQLQRLVAGMTRKRYGARLRIKLAVLFLGFVLLTTIPQAYFSLRLVALAASKQTESLSGTGITAGLSVLIEWQSAEAARLKLLAEETLLPRLNVAASPEALLEALQRLDPAIEAIELYGTKGRRLSAGPAAARLDAPILDAASGALPIETKGGIRRLRYAIKTETVTAVLCLRMPAGLESAISAMAASERKTAQSVAASTRWPQFIGIVYIFFVTPLLLLAMLLGIAAADFVAEPLGGLEEVTRRVSGGDFSARILAKPGDERGWLISSFNRMLDELERMREGERIQERVDAWKDLAQRLAHELKNPLTPIRLASERLLRMSKSDPGRVLGIIESSSLAIIAEVDSMDGLLADFRAFARLPTPEMEWVELKALVAESIAVFQASYPEITFICTTLPAETRLHMDRSMMKRALGNLISNSIEAMAGHGAITISANLVKTGDSGYCRLRLGDTGRGIPLEIRERVFLPYFTTKDRGTGLGLAIVERIVHDHGGRIRFESAEGIGTVFWLDLPIRT
ncbi:MAG: ATP-binding protein [Spirochaetota bacterium]